MNRELQFENFLNRLITKAVAEGPIIWGDLLEKLPGVSPDVLLDALRRSDQLRRVKFEATSPDRKTTTLPVAFRLWGEGILPTPHVLDACWWFSDPALAILATRIRQSNAKRVVLLGTPTLWHWLRMEGAFPSSVILVDSDRALRVPGIGEELVTCNVLSDRLPSPCPADLVVADPPWYPTEMSSFLLAARQFCRVGGELLLSVPAEGTRPGIEEEWQTLLQTASGLGFELKGFERSALLYLSPPFEHNAFLTAGVRPIPVEWRRGDLATFVRSREGVGLSPAPVPHVSWIDYSIDSVRFRLRNPEEDCREPGIPELISLTEGEILPSVSRRHPVRDNIDLWTSGNRVFRCNRRLVMMLILGAMESRVDPISVIEDNMHRKLCIAENLQLKRVVAKLWQLVEIEKWENLVFRQRYERHVDLSPN